MTGRAEQAGGGFSVLDGVALVAGAAVASLHIKGVIEHEITGSAWLIVACTFAWVAITAAGPFVYLLRGYARKVPGYPKVGDRLWAMLGLPWLLTALLRTTPESHVLALLLTTGLSIGLAVVSLIAMAVIWTTWVVVTPEQASQTFAPPWTNRVGLLLAVAWPVQCGVGMVVIG
jgi:hypothetical protein